MSVSQLIGDTAPYIHIHTRRHTRCMNNVREVEAGGGAEFFPFETQLRHTTPAGRKKRRGRESQKDNVEEGGFKFETKTARGCVYLLG